MVDLAFVGRVSWRAIYMFTGVVVFVLGIVFASALYSRSEAPAPQPVSDKYIQADNFIGVQEKNIIIEFTEKGE